MLPASIDMHMHRCRCTERCRAKPSRAEPSRAALGHWILLLSPKTKTSHQRRRATAAAINTRSTFTFVYLARLICTRNHGETY